MRVASAVPTLPNVPFKDASAYLDLAAGTYEFRVAPTGTTDVMIDMTQQILDVAAESGVTMQSRMNRRRMDSSE